MSEFAVTHSIEAIRRLPGDISKGFAKLAAAPEHLLHEVQQKGEMFLRTQAEESHQIHQQRQLRALHFARPVYLQAAAKPEASRYPSEREVRLAKDKIFFEQHRGEFESGKNWAGRDREGQLHLLPHSSAAADIFCAVDQATRVEKQPSRYFAGEVVGAKEVLAETVSGAVGMVDAASHPMRTLHRAKQNHVADKLAAFQRDSATLATGYVRGEVSQFAEAQGDPEKGGRATGHLLAAAGMAAAPAPWAKVRWLRGSLSMGAAEPLELGAFPSRTWRYHPAHTVPTGSIGAKPMGIPERIRPGCVPEKARGITRQIESAELLANKGYRVQHLPLTRHGKCPDMLIEGKVFDAYSPTTERPRNVGSQIMEKVEEEQAKRIVVNLRDCNIAPKAIETQLKTWPIPGLEEVIVIHKGTIEHIYP